MKNLGWLLLIGGAVYWLSTQSGPTIDYSLPPYEPDEPGIDVDEPVGYVPQDGGTPPPAPAPTPTPTTPGGVQSGGNLNDFTNSLFGNNNSISGL